MEIFEHKPMHFVNIDRDRWNTLTVEIKAQEPSMILNEETDTIFSPLY